MLKPVKRTNILRALFCVCFVVHFGALWFILAHFGRLAEFDAELAEFVR